jgi:hypothetical protein
MTVAAGMRFGDWRVISTDALGRRVTCQCVCGTVKVIGTEALLSGAAVSSCGCMPVSRAQKVAFRAELARQRRERERA